MKEVSYSVRLLKQSDLDEFKTFRSFALQESPTAFAKSDAEFKEISDEKLIGLVCHGEFQAVFAAFDDQNKILGMSGLYRANSQPLKHTGVVWGVYVLPDFRNRGIARRIMKQLISESPTVLKGVNRLTLALSETQPAAMGLYLGLGFKVHGREERRLCIDGKYFAEDLLSLDLIGVSV